MLYQLYDTPPNKRKKVIFNIKEPCHKQKQKIKSNCINTIIDLKNNSKQIHNVYNLSISPFIHNLHTH